MGGVGGTPGLLWGIMGGLVAQIFSHLTGLELSWVNGLILGAFIGATMGRSFRRRIFGVMAGGIGGLLGGWIYLAMPAGTVVDVEYIALAGLGWAILGGLIGAVSGLVEKRRGKMIWGTIVGAVGGVMAMFLWQRMVVYMADVVRLASSVLMEGSVIGMSIWVFITFVSIMVEKENVSY